MDLVLAYIAGLLTLINPCVLPILPIVLASSMQASRHGPAALAAGMAVSFVTAGMFVLVLGAQFGITEETMITFGAWAMLGFGLILLVPRAAAGFSAATAGMADRADVQMSALPESGLGPQFLGGMLLGLVWSPCIGPTLGGAISLASQGQSLIWSGLILTTFAFGVATIILALGYGTRDAIARRKAWMQQIAARSRPIMGGVFVLVAMLILTKSHHRIEAYLLETLPYWLTDLSVSV